MRWIFSPVMMLLMVGSSAAQTCPEGRTASGACVNAGLAASMKQDALVFSQPKISYTAFPILPSLDYDYRYPHNVIPDPGKPAPIGIAPPPPSP